MPPGLHIARVKMIFTLPARLHDIPLRLAYVEWFRPFRAREAATGLYTSGPSIQYHLVHAEVIPLDQIVRNCHMVLKFGVESVLIQETVIEKCTVFYLNPWLDFHSFCMFR
jgi:hypothetical protein